MEHETIENAPESEVIDQAETTVEETQQTIGDMAESVESFDEQPVEKTVPEYAFVAQKKALQKAEKELRELQAQKSNNAPISASSLSDIADKYDIDKNFIEELSHVIRNEATAEVESKISSKQAELNKQKKFSEAIQNAFNDVLETAPEYKTIANLEVIKQLALLPQNANKTVLQIVDDTYGNAIQGKRTIETTKPRGGGNSEPVDLKRADTDLEYYKEVMSDPVKKEKYNQYLLKRL